MSDLDDFTELLEELLADYNYKLVSVGETINQDVVPQYTIGSRTPFLVSGQQMITLNISAIRVQP